MVKENAPVLEEVAVNSKLDSPKVLVKSSNIIEILALLTVSVIVATPAL